MYEECVLVCRGGRIRHDPSFDNRGVISNQHLSSGSNMKPSQFHKNASNMEKEAAAALLSGLDMEDEKAAASAGKKSKENRL